MSQATRLLNKFASVVDDIARDAKRAAEASNFVGNERASFIETYTGDRLRALSMEMRVVADLYREHESNAA